MNQVLKLEAAASVRSLDVQPPAKTPTLEERTIAALHADIEDLRQALKDAETRRLSDVEAAHKKGRDEAQAEFKRSEEDALAALKTAAAGALSALEAHFAEADKFGLALALAALEKIVAEPARYQELIVACILQQVKGLRQDTILSILVSNTDFTDEISLANLAAGLGASAIVTASPRLSAGECRIELRLGAIDISLPEYWTKLQAQCRRLLGREPR